MDSNTTLFLISTGITFIYFLLKVCRYIFYAISHKTEGRLAAATPGCGEQKYGPDSRKEGLTEVYEQISGDNTEQYGSGTQRFPGSLPVPRRRKDVHFSSCGDVTEYSEKPSFRQNEKRLPSGGHRNTKNYYGEEPSGTYDDTPGVFTESSGWSNASDGQPSDDERTGRKERPDEILNDGVQGHRASATTYHTTGIKTQVSHVALQTDTCDTLYVTKNTLTAYTITIVQNSQALQYDQMHAALQTARNQSPLETPLRAEELLKAHFNLAVLADQKDVDISPDAPKPAANTQDAEPSVSAPDEQTYVKIPSRYAETSVSPRPHPTGAVAPTCRREYGLVNGIPAGYESDDSWDTGSHNHDHMHTHNIVPLLALRTWKNRPRRGCEQSRQNIMQTGHAPYPRPWDNQPYGRRTRSQQALRARAYHKVQCRYPVQ